MRFKFLVLLLLVIAQFSKAQQSFHEKGVASYYGDKFHGRKTASGEKFNMNAYTSAHRTLPFNTYLKVTNLNNGKSVIVRVNDRGPHTKNRIIDISKAAAKKIGLLQSGVCRVRIEVVDSATALKDNSFLIADCCYGELEEFAPIFGCDYYGNTRPSYGQSIEIRNSGTFSEEYIIDNLSKIKIYPIFNVNERMMVEESKKRLKQ